MATEQQLETEMEELYEEAKAILPRPPTAYLSMLRQYGGVETARRLVERSEPSDTFLKLIELGHPELTAEAVVLKPEYASLFSTQVAKIAQGRLPDQ